MIESLFRRYSQGIVAKDLVDGEMLIEVWPVEVILEAHGELEGDTAEYKSVGIDSAAVEFSVKAKSSISLTCEWIGETNRRTAPNVRRGESVTIWQYGEDDKFYWSSCGRTDGLRRGEHIIYSWSDVPADDLEQPTTLENSHTLEIDTFNKFVEFKTVDSNAEAYTYSFKLDMAASIFTMQDNVGNKAILNSANTLIHLENEKGTFLKLDLENIKMYAPDSFYAEAVNTVDVKCTDLVVAASKSIKMKTKATTLDSEDTIDITTKALKVTGSETVEINTTDFTCTASKSYTLTSAKVSINGSAAVNVASAAISLSGPVNIAGALTCTPGAGGGGASISGGLKVSDGGLKVAGGLTVDTINFTSGISGPGGAWHMP